MHTLINSKKEQFESAIDHLKKELQSIRTGRANPALVEDVKVVAYNAQMDIKSVASINIQDAQTLIIEPWDKGLIQAIEKAVREAELGVNPAVDGEKVRVSIPAMTEESRKALAKTLREKAEEAKVAIRQIREKLRDEVNKLEKDKEIGEDEKFKMLEELDNLTKEYTTKIEEIVEKKETEIMTV